MFFLQLYRINWGGGVRPNPGAGNHRSQYGCGPERVFPTPTLSPPRAHLRPAPLHTTLRALVRSSLTGGACCARAQGTATVRRTKVRRLQASIIPATNATARRLHRPREEPPGLGQAAPPPPCDLGPGPHHARREVDRALRIRERMERTGLFSVVERVAGAGEPSGWRRDPQDGSRRLR